MSGNNNWRCPDCGGGIDGQISQEQIDQITRMQAMQQGMGRNGGNGMGGGGWGGNDMGGMSRSGRP